MTSTLTPTCAFCGLRFASSPLLDLHVREDHLHRHRPPEPGHDNSSSRPSGQHRHGPAPHSKPAMTTRTEQAATTSGTRRPRASRAVTALRRAGAELLLASRALLRRAGARQPQHQEDRPASPRSRPAATSSPADHAP